MKILENVAFPRGGRRHGVERREHLAGLARHDDGTIRNEADRQIYGGGEAIFEVFELQTSAVLHDPDPPISSPDGKTGAGTTVSCETRFRRYDNTGLTLIVNYERKKTPIFALGLKKQARNAPE
jgi:hypothetical protein